MHLGLVTEWPVRPGGPSSAALIAALLCAFTASPSLAQYAEEESTVTVNAMIKSQTGVFVPLLSSAFTGIDKNEAERRSNPAFAEGPCDPIVTPAAPCRPTNHGREIGALSIARLTLQMEAHWDISSKWAVHGILRAVRSYPLASDEWAQPPQLVLREDLAPGEDLAQARRDHARDYAYNNYQNEVDLRELYVDYWPNDWLSFRVGRQQVAWGETGQFRLLDVVNPADNTWHFGPLESFEDQRIPLWMAVTTFDIPAINSALEALWIPGVDRAQDMVNPPLINVGAWGLPYSNQPPNFTVNERNFIYPGGGFFDSGKFGGKNILRRQNMRGGARLKGVLGTNGGYSLVYFYTHMMRPVLTDVNLELRDPENPEFGYDESTARVVDLVFPRKHVVGGSFEWTIDSPVATTFRFEGAAELSRTFAPNTNKGGDNETDPSKIIFRGRKKPVLNYALVLQRPTMIRFLNPTQNFLLVAQFMHTYIHDVDPIQDDDLVQLIQYNDWRIQKNSYTLVAFARTTYAHGLFTPKLVGVWMANPDYKDSGFVHLDLGFRFGPHYRLNIQITDFVGRNAYRDIGLFRDRDEVAASFTVLL